MARISRKELKKDEFAEEVSKTAEFIQAHKDKLMVAAVVAGAALVAVLAGYLVVQKRTVNANEALARALRAYHAPVRPPGATPAEGDKSFASERERNTQAFKEFLVIAQKYSWLKPGRIARYYAGICQANLDNLVEAEKEWNAVIQGRDKELSALARFALANKQVASGKGAEAEKHYRYLVEHPTATVPKNAAQLALAGNLRASRPAEAERLYREIEKEHPNTSASDMARQALAEMRKTTP